MASELTADMAAVAEKQKAYQEGLQQFVAAQGRKATPLLRALSLQAPRQGEAHGLVFAPQALANTMTDPGGACALLQALRSPTQLGQSTIALRMKEESLREVQEGSAAS